MGTDAAADGHGAVSEIVRHWQEQVAAAEERAAATNAAHAERAAAVRDEHARCASTALPLSGGSCKRDVAERGLVV